MELSLFRLATDSYSVYEASSPFYKLQIEDGHNFLIPHLFQQESSFPHDCRTC